MIKNIEIGEIIQIKNRDWLMVETTHKNGRMEWEQPTLILLDRMLVGVNKKPYYKRQGIVAEKIPNKKFKTKKLGNITNEKFIILGGIKK